MRVLQLCAPMQDGASLQVQILHLILVLAKVQSLHPNGVTCLQCAVKARKVIKIKVYNLEIETPEAIGGTVHTATAKLVST